MKICIACGDHVESPQDRLAYLEATNVWPPGENEMLYCRTCANEKYRGVISTKPAQLYSAGSDNKLEPNPWSENAVRDLEDGR